MDSFLSGGMFSEHRIGRYKAWDVMLDLRMITKNETSSKYLVWLYLPSFHFWAILLFAFCCVGAFQTTTPKIGYVLPVIDRLLRHSPLIGIPSQIIAWTKIVIRLV